ncbi:MAG: hypothetical protein WCT44_01910 [Candidatus Paceibacterota bacterium]
MSLEKNTDGGPILPTEEVLQLRADLENIKYRLARETGEASVENTDGTLSFDIGRDIFYKKHGIEPYSENERADNIRQLKEAVKRLEEEIRVLEGKK